MAKSKNKSKKSGNNNNSSAKNIKALIAQNKMTEHQNAEAKREAEERQAAREAEKQARLERELEAQEAKEAAKLEAVEADEVIVDETVAEATPDTDSKAEKEEKQKDKDKSKKAKKKKERQGLGKKIKDTTGELKKVSWPGFKEVVKKTGVVFAVVIFFGAILLGFDFLMSLLYKLFV